MTDTTKLEIERGYVTYTMSPKQHIAIKEKYRSQGLNIYSVFTEVKQCKSGIKGINSKNIKRDMAEWIPCISAITVTTTTLSTDDVKQHVSSYLEDIGYTQPCKIVVVDKRTYRVELTKPLKL